MILVFSLSTFLLACEITAPDLIRLESIPADTELSETSYSSYVNKLYISLLGHKPSQVELKTAINQLKGDKLHITERRRLIERLQSTSQYYAYQYKTAEFRILNFIFNPDPKHIQTTIDIWQKLPESKENQAEIDRLKKLKTIEDDLRNGSLELIGLHKLLAFNSYYDFINMGSENFVVSLFQNFLFRYPTQVELSMGEKMVDRQPSWLFLKSGSSKSDFVSIFFQSTAYFEGLVIDLVKRYLYRPPSSEELAYYTRILANDGDFKTIQMKILSLDEFAEISQ